MRCPISFMKRVSTNWTLNLSYCASRAYSVVDRRFLFDESDLSENFVRGWGPGGQAVNKTANCVVLRHIPTGLFVKCQDTRILERNREIARIRLNQKLDELMNGEQSEIVRERKELEAKERQRYNRTKRRLAAKLAFKAREGLNSPVYTESTE
ncbi:Mitochondrial polypeptide chain release factor [Paragonimus heterotremus]|uniref:Mitochondrial polypeptide chain release factor n=1 Tax=Paragonimus heterotremus TaxID=100268 RepID=A0A8J4T5U2_9TREM|nr:Mitochondrial polypeptide chain release factor [Paragonimus heterotremus]